MMRTKTKTILWVTGIAIALLIVAVAFVLTRFLAETGKMKALETGATTDGVYRLKDGYVNLFLVKGTDGYIAVDAGDHPEHITRELQRLEIDADRVKGVFLTHTDRDHIAALGLFGKAKVYISRDEEQMINGKTPRFFSLFKNALPVRYELMDDGQTIDVAGVKIKGILTPGHTPGAMCYLVNGRFLFTGDTMSLKDGRAELFNNLFNMDSEQQKISLHKLKNIPEVKTVFTAHYGLTDNPKRAFENW
jgi:hydroxyacylglutathione hydrolase